MAQWPFPPVGPVSPGNPGWLPEPHRCRRRTLLRRPQTLWSRAMTRLSLYDANLFRPRSTNASDPYAGLARPPSGLEAVELMLGEVPHD